MELDYKEIGRRIAKRRKELGFKQAQVAEAADISNNHMSSIERAVSIPSTEVIMRLAAALDTTPDAFLVGTAVPSDGGEWRGVAELLRDLDDRQLSAARSFLTWLRDQDL